MVKCEFCDAELSNKANLKSHQSKAKYCLNKQKLSHINDSYLCQYCNTQFLHKHVNETHEKTCKEKINNAKLSTQKEYYENLISTLKLQHERSMLSMKEEIINLKADKRTEQEKAEIYNNLFNKDQECILKLAEKSSVTTTNNTIKSKNIVMNTLNLSAERLESLKDTYNMSHYEAGGRGQVEWLVPNVLTDENGNLIYGCGDVSRKNFFYYDKGNKVVDLHAETLKAAIRPIMDVKLKEYKKVKCRELAEIEDEDESNAAMEKFNSLYKENKGLGVEFEKRLVEMTYRK